MNDLQTRLNIITQEKVDLESDKTELFKQVESLESDISELVNQRSGFED